MTSGGWVVIGTLIGALGGWVGAYITVRAENKRHRKRLAFEAGLREWEMNMRDAHFRVDKRATFFSAMWPERGSPGPRLHKL